MEHRWGTRRPLDVVVRLDWRPQLLALGRLRNASASGAYVETCAAPPLMSRIHIELVWGNLRRDEPHRIAAYVVRADSAGIALEWCDFAPAEILALIERDRPRTRAERRRNEAPSVVRYLPARGSRSTIKEHSVTDVV